jgi:hypothetical protein
MMIYLADTLHHEQGDVVFLCAAVRGHPRGKTSITCAGPYSALAARSACTRSNPNMPRLPMCSTIPSLGGCARG